MLVEKIFELTEQENPLIAVESPLQERVKLLYELAIESTKRGTNCYIWMLEDDELHQLQFHHRVFSLSRVDQYKAISPKNSREDYFEILRFWKTTALQGILIVEGVFPWVGQVTDPDFFLTSEWIKSALMNLKLYNYKSNKTLVLLGANANLASDIAPQIPTIRQHLPSSEEIRAYLSPLRSQNYTQQEIDEIANTCLGLYLADIEVALKAIPGFLECGRGGSVGGRGEIRENEFSTSHPSHPNHPNHTPHPNQLIKDLSSYKINFFRQIYDVEFMEPPDFPIGGLELMQSAFKRYKRLLTQTAKSYNLRPPKGVLLIGPPGTGKSHSAKACSQILGLPLIIVDWSNFRSFGNMAEYKLKKLLALVDRINRLIFYLDDFDKGFAGDDDLSRRLAGTLLTWMQERTSDVLIIASANNIQCLPPELTRSGRFDDIFKVDLPNNGERHEIFKIHLARFDHRFRGGQDAYTTEQWQKLLKATHRCVGAEIQALVEKAAISTFCQMFPEQEAGGFLWQGGRVLFAGGASQAEDEECQTDVNSQPQDLSKASQGEELEVSLSSYPPAPRPLPSASSSPCLRKVPSLEITLDALLEARKNINPLAIREADRIENIRNIADLQGLPSSPMDSSIYSVGNINIFD